MLLVGLLDSLDRYTLAWLVMHGVVHRLFGRWLKVELAVGTTTHGYSYTRYTVTVRPPTGNQPGRYGRQ